MNPKNSESGASVETAGSKKSSSNSPSTAPLFGEGNGDTLDSEKVSGEISYEEYVDYDQEPPPDIVAYNELRSCADLARLHESGQLEIQPDFQREVIWQRPAQTRFIDSLIKQLPIPSMCFSLDQKSRKWQVIDGLQRMTAITKFLGDAPWKLSRLGDIDTRLSGSDNSDFKEGQHLSALRERVENLTIPVTVIRCDYSKLSHMEFLFTIFHRLNKGGVTLNNQEIRNCIYSGRFNDLLKRIDQQLPSWNLIKPQIAGSTARFKSVELLLRFLAFHDSVDLYSGSLPMFLNSYMQKYRNATEEKLSAFENLIGDTSEFCAARVLEHLPSRIGFAAWEAILVGVARNLTVAVDLGDQQIGERIAQLLRGPELSQEALRGALSGTEKVKARIGAAIRAFA